MVCLGMVSMLGLLSEFLGLGWFVLLSFLGGKMFFFSTNIFSGGYTMDYLSSWMLLLTGLIFFLVIPSSVGDELSFTAYQSFIMILGVFLVLFFTSPGMLEFYLLFEVSLVPMTGLVLGWGYQPERESAGYALLFYTITSSLPLLMMVLILGLEASKYEFFQLGSMVWSSLSFWGMLMMLFMFLGLLVKLPLFMVHLWLPKAHTEASVVGSMILAAVMLKTGGYGLLRFLFASFSFSNFEWVGVVSLIGIVYISILCVQQLDAKLIIAYSSVAHMGMVCLVMMYSSGLGAKSALILMLAHGLSSSVLFFLANQLYLLSGSRSIVVLQGSIQESPLLSSFWFLSLSAGMAGPLTINLLSEILVFQASVGMYYGNVLFLGAGTFMSGAYSMILYSFMHQGSGDTQMYFSLPMGSKSFLVVMFHLFWAYFSVLGLSLF